MIFAATVANNFNRIFEDVSTEQTTDNEMLEQAKERESFPVGNLAILRELVDVDVMDADVVDVVDVRNATLQLPGFRRRLGISLGQKSYFPRWFFSCPVKFF